MVKKGGFSLMSVLRPKGFALFVILVFQPFHDKERWFTFL